jgi:hypothetical protein
VETPLWESVPGGEQQGGEGHFGLGGAGGARTASSGWGAYKSAPGARLYFAGENQTPGTSPFHRRASFDIFAAGLCFLEIIVGRPVKELFRVSERARRKGELWSRH